MVTTGQVVGLALACVLLIVVPGPSVLFVVGRALAHGRATALASVVGNTVGTCLAAICVALGLGPLLERSALLYEGIRLAGAAYLVWLGVTAFRSAGAAAAPDREAALPAPSRWRAVRAGALVGLSNPKAFVILAAVLPPFVDRAQGHVPAQMLALATVPVLIGLATDSGWALVAGSARRWFARSPRRTVLVGRVGGASMVGLGVSVALADHRA